MDTVQILAWYPRTYLKEFMDLLPAMLNKDTVVEVCLLHGSLSLEYFNQHFNFS